MKGDKICQDGQMFPANKPCHSVKKGSEVFTIY